MFSRQISALEEVKWQDWHLLAKDIDAAAAALNTEAYQPLLTDVFTPFPLPRTPEAGREIPNELFITFDLEDATNIVASQYLSVNPRVPWILPDAVTTRLADQGDLHLVTKEDACMCSSLLRMIHLGLGTCAVATTDDGDVVQQDGRNCWSPDIRQPGEVLDETQSIIPHNYLEFWGGSPKQFMGSDPYVTRILPACGEGGDRYGEVHLVFRRLSTGKYLLTSAARQILPHYLTWPVRKEWMERLVQAFDRIGTSSGGTKFVQLVQAVPKMLGQNTPGPPGPPPTPPAWNDDWPQSVLDNSHCGTTPPLEFFWGTPTSDQTTANAVIPVYPMWEPPYIPGTELASVFGRQSAHIGPYRAPLFNNCIARFEEMQQALNCLDVHVNRPSDGSFVAEPYDAPGCLTRVGVLPWDELACNSVECKAGNQSLYAHTYNQMRRIASKLGDWINPRDGNNVCPDCCFDGAPKGNLEAQAGRSATEIIRRAARRGYTPEWYSPGEGVGWYGPVVEYNESSAVNLTSSDLWGRPPSRDIGSNCAAGPGSRVVVAVKAVCATPAGPPSPVDTPDNQGFGGALNDGAAVGCGSPKTYKTELVDPIIMGSLTAGGKTDGVTTGGDQIQVAEQMETATRRRAMAVGFLTPRANLTVEVSCQLGDTATLCSRCAPSDEFEENEKRHCLAHSGLHAYAYVWFYVFVANSGSESTIMDILRREGAPPYSLTTLP